MRPDNADQPASPTVHTNAHLNGLTKREQFAAMAMQGLLVSGTMDSATAAFNAVDCADELLKALEAE